MPLNADQAYKLQGFVAIFEGRGPEVIHAGRVQGPLRDVELDDLADTCKELQEALLSIELLCARAVRASRQDGSADKAARRTTKKGTRS